MPNVQLELLIDDTAVAQANINDNEEPSNLAIFYEGAIAADSKVEVTVMSGTRVFEVPAEYLQWGYKLYNSGYPLIDTLDTTCVM